jgi:menaquinone-specific isochorismate synthase
MLKYRLARQLLTSDKDLREHQHVVASILRRLADLGLKPDSEAQPGLLVLPNVQHLCTPLSGPITDDTHILDLAETLHPTPALGGAPREKALPDIAAWEPFDRGLFGGLVGWVDTQGQGELAVGIRSALVEGSHARLFAGAGIVKGSDPELEFQETSLKMEALLRCIRGAAG